MKYRKDKVTYDMEDLIVYPDGTSCYRYELHEMGWKSDDFVVLPFGSKEYNDHFKSMKDNDNS